MSTPDQEQAALRHARLFLRAIASGAHPLRPITQTRQEARRILKHYPLFIDAYTTHTTEDDT